MAWKYRQEFHEEGDAIIPDDWIENQNEFVSEFNGFLDRDNFRDNGFSRHNGVSTSSDQNALPVVAANTFNDFYVYAKSTFTVLDPSEESVQMLDLGGDKESVGWSSKGVAWRTSALSYPYDDDAETPELDITLSDGGLFIVEFSANFKWFGRDEYLQKDVNGNPEAAWGGIHNPSWGDGSEGHLWDVYVPDDDPNDRVGPRRMFACIKFRVVCNGGIIAESGWYANHVQRNSVYLVGAAPVTAGNAQVRVEYKLAYVDNRIPGESIERAGVIQPVRMFERELIVNHRKR
tara:strand:+ start:22702 stop:23571 length:870 start_codon:yes stop_codon:yes gene_type:complete